MSSNPAHLERTIRKDQRSTSIDAAAFTSTDSRNHPSTDSRPSSSTDLPRSTSIDPTPRTSIDPQSRNMVAIVILRMETYMTRMVICVMQHHEKLGEGDFEVESSMSFSRSQWCLPMSMDAHRSTYQNEDRSTDYFKHRSTLSAESTVECSAKKTLTHPPLSTSKSIDRMSKPSIDKERPTSIDPPPLTSHRSTNTSHPRVRLPSIDSNRINTLRSPPKPLANPPEPTTNPSDTTPEPMQVDEATEGRV
ncbi:hypothetical protein IGI04_019416 [Brassica rapa subsp. trilocularis]|uniref:DUF4005 domain-containing protein n=1 Tax=Brassica rapa subsp. trilocularis TaxID=1813537 RepID=A0ABQ7MG57_BRACM|nr:hypothetical protein IGI04_019416 [Brassica rapa subsp. trilocularis]